MPVRGICEAMTTHHYLACDLGAESGRVLLGTLAQGRLALQEIHRFSNGPIAVGGTLRWDVLRVLEELKAGLRKAAAGGASPASVSCDSWGVDYVLLCKHEPMLTLPFHYRDPRTDGGLERAFAVVPADEIFKETGIQFMAINTLYQLHDDLRKRPEVLNVADTFLNIGDYFNFLLSGRAVAEESLASTTQLYSPRLRDWSAMLIDRFGFPARIFPEIVASGTALGRMRSPVAEETGLDSAEIIAGCSHDTAAAVAAVPASGGNWAYLSSGTWSLLGTESAEPIIDAKSRRYNFTNEVGYGGAIRFLKNIVGLWLIQECRREWASHGREYSYEELARMAAASPPLKSFINPAREEFLKPGQMPEKIAAFCRTTGQPAPETPGEFVRTALQSLALLYRRTLEQLEDASGRSVNILHIVGGGSKNQLLNQFTADATQRTVLAGPSECTGLGNVIVQAIALGHLSSLDAARESVRESFPTMRYKPADTSTWDEAYARFLSLV